MDESTSIKKLIPDVAEALVAGWHLPGSSDRQQDAELVCQQSVLNVLNVLVLSLVPGCHGEESIHPEARTLRVGDSLETAVALLAEQLNRSFVYTCEHQSEDDCAECAARADEVLELFVNGLVDIQQLVMKDIKSAYEGDPAAQSMMEVVQSYPGLYAIIVHRISHFLYANGVPLMPRIMSESAHSKTGIDIHPGAKIGPAFFIDHGTGVVIGETCEIGESVKLYQGVTLGALSFEKDGGGKLVKGIKRHPNVEDHVIIYSGATILGGETTIGAHSVIGGNVWLTHSVPPYSKVYNQQPEPHIHPGNGG
jgi:serine O-acetyltransferase